MCLSFYVCVYLLCVSSERSQFCHLWRVTESRLWASNPHFQNRQFSTRSPRGCSPLSWPRGNVEFDLWFCVIQVLLKKDQKGPSRFSKGTNGDGKGPVPPTQKEHIANIEQIVYIAALANCQRARGSDGGPKGPETGCDEAADAFVSSESRP